MQNSDLQILHKLRLRYSRNPHIGYLNINSLRNKIIDVRGRLLTAWLLCYKWN